MAERSGETDLTSASPVVSNGEPESRLNSSARARKSPNGGEKRGGRARQCSNGAVTAGNGPISPGDGDENWWNESGNRRMAAKIGLMSPSKLKWIRTRADCTGYNREWSDLQKKSCGNHWEWSG